MIVRNAFSDYGGEPGFDGGAESR